MGDDEQGDHDDLLQTFVRHQIVNAVHPVMEQVKQLQAKVSSLSNSLANADAKTDASTAKTAKLEDELTAMRVAAAKSTAALEKAKVGITTGEDERAQLFAEHDKTRKTVVELKDVQTAVSENVKLLNMKTAEIEGQLRNFGLGLWKADKNIESLNEGLARMKEAHMEVKDKDSEHSKEIAVLARGTEELERELSNLAKMLDQNKEDRMKSVDRLDSHIADVERAADLAHRGIEELRDDTKAIRGDLSRLHDAVEHKDGSETGMDQVKTVQKELLGKAAAHNKRFDRLEESLEQLGGQVSEEKQKTDRALSDLHTRIESNLTDIRALDNVAKATRDELPRHAHTMQEHQVALHKVLNQVAVNQEEMRRAASWQKAAASAVESHTIQLQQLRDEGDSGDRRLSHVDEAVRILQKDVHRMGDVLESLKKRFGKSVSQFGRGFANNQKVAPQSPGALSTEAPSPRFAATGSSLGDSLPGLGTAGRPLTARNRADLGASSSAWMA